MEWSGEGLSIDHLRGYTVGSKVGVGTAHQQETVRIRKKERGGGEFIGSGI